MNYLSTSILIVGGGTWGCSGALNLARRGYKNITVLDSHSFPSSISAGNDINKIMEEGEPSENDTEEEYVEHRLEQISANAWLHDPLIRPFYHRTGFIYSACSAEAYETVLSYVRGHEQWFKKLSNPAEFRGTMPDGVLTGDFPEWRGFFKEKGAGWIFARGALEAVHNECLRLGVKFIASPSQGIVVSLLYKNEKGGDIVGARTIDGVEHRADHTILAAGANSDGLLDFEKQLRPTAWTLSHILLNESEAHLFKDLPVLFNVEKGFFIEPDAETRELKVCDEHPGYLNPVIRGDGMCSVPFARNQIPIEAEQRVREFLKDTIPTLADREFIFGRVCWDADTVDRMFVIDQHPKYPSLVVAAGGSGHGFKMMPAVGKMIADTVEGVVEPRLRKALRWRPEIAVDRNWWDTQGRFGANGKVMDFRDVKKWTQFSKGDWESNITQQDI